MILDIHTHHPAPAPESVISLSFTDDLSQIETDDRQLWSAGIHPWHINAVSDEDDALARLAQLLGLKQCVAVGEAGIDLLKGGPMFRQLLLLRRQVELSENAAKPMVLHCVKGADIIAGLHRDLKPTQPWCIHGCRLKPQAALQLSDKGIYMSFGALFNKDTLQAMPPHLILAETDESELSPAEIMNLISEVRGEDMTETIRVNTAAFLNIN